MYNNRLKPASEDDVGYYYSFITSIRQHKTKVSLNIKKHIKHATQQPRNKPVSMSKPHT